MNLVLFNDRGSASCHAILLDPKFITQHLISV